MAIFFISYIIVLTKVIAEIWEHVNIAVRQGKKHEQSVRLQPDQTGYKQTNKQYIQIIETTLFGGKCRSEQI